ncbi:MAG: hypothetical protein KA712_05545 [Myxococcales bacterium]|nr:hypothetical protein [Myxococcales bacterium]
MKRVVRMSIVSLALALGVSGGPALAKRKAPAKSGGKAAAAVPNANAEEIEKLKGEFKWGMEVPAVQRLVEQRLRDSYAESLKKAIGDPTQYSRVRGQMEKEVKGLKAKYTEFEGRKTGYDVSIVDQEFAHKTDESMLVSRDENNTRYYFFSDGKLYKLFIAFGKDILADKTFEEFGDLMQARFGKAKTVKLEEKRKDGVVAKLDHFEWASAAGDGLRLVDRSEFYDVYCLVIYDRKEEERLRELRARVNPRSEGGDSLVEAVLSGSRTDADVNENIIDQIAGKEIGRPGAPVEDVVVPYSSGMAPSAAEVNARPKAAARTSSAASSSGGSGKKSKAMDDIEL